MITRWPGREQVEVTNADAMVTEACSLRPNALDILCVLCAWEGHAEPPAAPWPVFRNHACWVPVKEAS